MSLAGFVAEHNQELTAIANASRGLSMDAVLKAASGHIGLPLGGAEMATLLYFGAMKHDPKDPSWIDRDRFVLSAGHGSMLQYSMLHLAGYDVSLDDIRDFRQLDSKTPGHPEYGHTAGVECTTGPLGQGLAMAVGMALAERMLGARLNSSKVEAVIDHKTYVIAGDGCLQEGVSGEASSFAGTQKLNKLITLYDSNNITIDGTIDIAFTEDVGQRYEAYGWNVVEADGNDFASLATALDQAHENAAKPAGSTGPTLIVCTTVAGKSAEKWEGQPKVHGNPLSAEDIAAAKTKLGLDPDKTFHVDRKTQEAAESLIAARAELAKNWSERRQAFLASGDQTAIAQFEAHFNTDVPKLDPMQIKGDMASRAASGAALKALAESDPRLVGGSADLAGSNVTTLPDSSFVSAEDSRGRNVHFGVREHGMAAIGNGMALHGGFLPYTATFAVFSDYMRPAIRLAALMKTRQIFILTHDSYGVGEDGPTHQPVEHAAALRVIPGLQVLRPGDATETAACWNAAIRYEGPTVLLLSRQKLACLAEKSDARDATGLSEGIENGAYTLRKSQNKGTPLTLLSCGSELAATLDAAAILEERGFEDQRGDVHSLAVSVVSVPNLDRLRGESLDQLVPRNELAVAVEAQSGQDWGRVVGRDGLVISMSGFGASAPQGVLEKKFGFDKDSLVNTIRTWLKS